jgi:acyl-CoA thioester hydrolase
MERLYEGHVLPDEIDDLGHMNVRFYAQRALLATERLLAEHGLDTESCAAMGTAPEVHDIYTRHHREQLAGAPLAVQGGVIEIHDESFRLYHELLNTQSGELAATFVHGIRMRSLADRSSIEMPDMTRKSLAEALVAWPDHGRTRSIDLDRASTIPTLADVRDRGLALRKERCVTADECDSNGFVQTTRRQDLVWGGDPVPPHRGGPPLHDLEGGGKMSMAALETRSVLTELPRVGTRIQSFSATVEVGRKVTVRRAWVFDVEREALLFSNTFVDIALHLGLRRSMAIPDDLRAQFESKVQPDLR